MQHAVPAGSAARRFLSVITTVGSPRNAACGRAFAAPDCVTACVTASGVAARGEKRREEEPWRPFILLPKWTPLCLRNVWAASTGA